MSATPAATPTLYCSFCGKSQHEVRKLIAGPTAYICDECVNECLLIVAAERDGSFRHPQLQMECLKLAVSLSPAGSVSADVISDAAAFVSFVHGALPVSAPAQEASA